jgi:hypothetical protein
MPEYPYQTRDPEAPVRLPGAEGSGLRLPAVGFVIQHPEE